MTRQEKTAVIQTLQGELSAHKVIYLADISGLNAAATEKLRRNCFNASIKLSVVKNTLLEKAIEGTTDKNLADFVQALKGNTALMLTNEAGNAPAKLIKNARRTSDKPILKAAFIDDIVFVGDDKLSSLAALKSKNELIGDIIGLLQSPIRTVISALLNKENIGDSAEKVEEAPVVAEEKTAPEASSAEAEEATTQE